MVGAVIFLQIVAFSPKRLEDDSAVDAVPPGALRPTHADSVVAPSIPADRIPEYTIEGFQGVSTQSGVKQWRIQAERVFFYQADGIAHARITNSDIYDAKGEITTVSSMEAKYFMQSKDLELFTNVKANFPSGLETLSPYLKYEAKTKEVDIPIQFPVEGHSVEPANKKPKAAPTETFEFNSKGLHYDGVNDRILLLSQVNVRVKKQTPNGLEITTIESDFATIDRKKNKVFFTMLEARPDELRFVKISQPGMSSKSRRAEFRINSSSKKLRTVRALDDVKIVERPKIKGDDPVSARRRGDPEKPRYATAGLAEFDSYSNLIILREYPQVYQDRDTITGETIIVHRDSDLVEVDQSNAFTEGNENEE